MDFLINIPSFLGILKNHLSYLSLVVLIACHSGEESVFNSGKSQEKPFSELSEKAGRNLGAKAQDEDLKEVASATYGVRLVSNSGARLCDGEVSFQIMSNFTIKFPQAEVNCLSLKIDLGGILASVGAGAISEGGFVSDGKVLSVKKIAGGEFTPPRPVMLGPVIQDLSKFRNLKSVTDHVITAKDKSGALVKSKGTFAVEVLSEKTTYSNKYLSKPFENVLHWQITSTGFDNIPPQNGLIFKKVEWFFNTRPIMIPQINVFGDVSGFLSENDKEVGSFIGDFELNLVVKKHQTE